MFRRQCWISFDADESTLRLHRPAPASSGADRIVWASDFPHPDAKYPGTTTMLGRDHRGARPDEQVAIAGGNAADLYGIDLALMAAGVAERVLGPWSSSNNGRVRAAVGDAPNPRPSRREPWHDHARRARSRRSAPSGSLRRRRRAACPGIEDLLERDQGNKGSWRAGLLVANGRPVGPVAARFPVTTAALLGVPGMRSALWSELEPGAEIPEHSGPDAGVLRYHLGVRCGDDAAVRVGDTVVPYRDGRGRAVRRHRCPTRRGTTARSPG